MSNKVKNKEVNPEQARHQYAMACIKRLSKPADKYINLAKLLTLASGIFAAGPYIGLVGLGDYLLGLGGATPSPTRVHETLFFIILALGGRLVLYFLALLVTHYADLRLKDGLRRGILERISQAPLASFSESSSGQLRKAVQDDTQDLHTIIAHGPVDSLNAVVMPLCLWIYAFYLDWRMGLIAVATIPLFIVLYGLGLVHMGPKMVEMNVKLARLSASMVEFVNGIGVVKIFGQVGQAHQRYRDSVIDFKDFYKELALPQVTRTVLANSFITAPVILFATIFLGSRSYMAGNLTLVQVIYTSLLALMLPTSIMSLVMLQWNMDKGGESAIRICSILDSPVLEETQDPSLPQSFDIQIKNLSFSYGDLLALDSINLNLEEGTTTALIGPSGSGKSTLARLLARFDDPDSGRILLGGVDLRDIPQDRLYTYVSFVLQDSQVLKTSIKNNILLGRPGASEEEIIQAARDAEIHDYIMTLPKAYDSMIGEDTSLSGGQAQRINIARAFLASTPILILDEATAFFDPDSELEIQRALSRLARDKTVLVIGHRPASIRGADKLVLLREGRLIVEGGHEDLLDQAYYRRLLALKFDPEGGSDE